MCEQREPGRGISSAGLRVCGFAGLRVCGFAGLRASFIVALLGLLKKKKKKKRKFTSGIGQEPKAPSPLLPTFSKTYL